MSDEMSDARRLTCQDDHENQLLAAARISTILSEARNGLLATGRVQQTLASDGGRRLALPAWMETDEHRAQDLSASASGLYLRG